MRENGTWQQVRANPEAGATGVPRALTILVADDEIVIRSLVGKILRSCGYTVLEAADGVEALEVAEQHTGPIHLLLTDWSMPRLDGSGLIRRLSSGRPEMAILVMSGYMNLAVPREATVLRKPFKAQDLVDKIKRVLRAQC